MYSCISLKYKWLLNGKKQGATASLPNKLTIDAGLLPDIIMYQTCYNLSNHLIMEFIINLQWENN